MAAQVYNRSHARYNRHNNFLRVRKRRQFLSWLGVQDARLTATGKTFTVTSVANGIAASGVLTTNASLPANSSTVVIGVKTYTWQTALTNVDGNVLIGVSVATALANLASAINLTAGSGTTYAAATTANVAGTSAVAAATTVTVTATAKGTAGNSIASTQAGTSNCTWGAATLLGVIAAATAGSLFTSASHGFKDFAGPFLCTNSGGALPGGLLATQQVWMHVVDTNTFQLAAGRRGIELDERLLDTAASLISVTSLGTGTQTIKRDISTKAGVFELLRRNKPETIMATTSANALN